MVLMVVVAAAVTQGPCEGTWPKLALVIDGAGVVSSLEAAVRAEAGYEAAQAQLCVVDSPEVAATARVEWPERGPLSLSITSSPAFGQSLRQLSRTLELTGVPADGVALAIGSNLGELLREARREIPALAPPAEPSTWGVGGLVAGEAFGGGQLHGGLDVFGRFRLASRVSLEPSLGFRLGVEASSTHGSVTSWLVGGALHALVDLVRFGAFTVSAVAGGRVGWLHFDGRATALSTAASGATWISSVRGGAELEWLARPARLFLRVTAGAPLRSAVATDAGVRVSGTTGVEVGAALGFGGAF